MLRMLIGLIIFMFPYPKGAREKEDGSI